MKKLVLALMFFSSFLTTAQAIDKVRSGTISSSQSAVATTPLCDNSSLAGDYVLQFFSVRNGNSVSGTYAINFDGKSTGTLSTYGLDSSKSFKTNTEQNITYSVFDGQCEVLFAITLSDGVTQGFFDIFLDKMVTTKKPFSANHGTGFFGATAQSDAGGTATLQRWIEKK